MHMGIHKPIVLVAWFLVFPLVGAVAAAEESTSDGSTAEPSRIERVVVFSDRAEVTRLARAGCQAGSGEAVFGHLPTSIDRRTLRTEAADGARIIGLTSQVVVLAEQRDERAKKLHGALRDLDDQLRTLAQRQEASREQVARLQQYAGFWSGLLSEQVRNPQPDIGQWSSLLDLLTGQRLTEAGKQHELQIKMRALQRKRELLQRRLAHLGNQAAREALQVRVAVDCQKATRPAIRLSYVVPGATWHPEYDLRFVPQGKAKVGKGTAELTVSAVVQQATGEDWQDVRIALSTAKPKLGSEAPVPMPITVNGSEVSDQKVLVQATERREQLARAGGPTEAGPVSSQLEDRGQSFVLSMPHRTTVRSDGRPYWMPVDRVRTSATSLLVTIPKLKPQVFQVMQLSNPAAYPLLPGQVHVHRAGAYIGDLHLDYKAPGEAMEVSLGPDSELRAVRKSLKHIDRSPGFLSSTRHLKRAFQIELKSNARKAVKVQVRENIPVSKIDDVKVELEKDKTTPGFELDAYRGFISWGVELRAGEEKQLDLAYTIHLPEDWKTR